MTAINFLIGGVIVFLVILPVWINLALAKRKEKKIKDLENDWGNKVKIHGNQTHLTKVFHNLKSPYKHDKSNAIVPTEEQLLCDNNISDLDIDDLFVQIDNTHSKVGEQYLYYTLCRPQLFAEKLEHFETKIDHYNSNKKSRIEVQYLLSKLNENGTYFLPHLFLGKKQKLPSWHSVPLVISILSLTCLIAAFFDVVFWFAVLFFFATNVIIHYWNKKEMLTSIRSFSELKKLISTTQNIKNFDVQFRGEFDVSKLKSMSKYLSVIQTEERFSSGGFDDIAWMLLEYMKIYFLLDINAYFRCLKFIEEASDVIEDMYMYVGEIDAAISVANFRLQIPYYSNPIFTNNKKELIAEEVFHPLIKNCTSNSAVINNKSMLITGSNMSGKTTYIRAMAINAILSQTINTSLAKKYEAPFLKIATSIRITDDVEEGKSYFLEEVVRIGELVNGVDDKTAPHLFVIDEVFKGTNTKERVAASKAILSYLNQDNNIVMVSTHDLELVPLLKDQFDLYHFEENVIDGMLKFDHKIKPGSLKTTNAITLLEVAGYPKQITEEARNQINV